MCNPDTAGGSKHFTQPSCSYDIEEDVEREIDPISLRRDQIDGYEMEDNGQGFLILRECDNLNSQSATTSDVREMTNNLDRYIEDLREANLEADMLSK